MKTLFKVFGVLFVIGLIGSAFKSDGSPVEVDEDTASSILNGTATEDEWADYYSIAQDLGEACLEEDVKDFAKTNNNGWTDGKTVFTTITDRYTDNPTPTVMGTNAFGGLMIHFARKIVIKQRDGEYFAECVSVE